MPGIYARRTWQYDPEIYAPPKYKRACRYDVFIPEKLAELALTLDATVVGMVSEAERDSQH